MIGEDQTEPSAVPSTVDEALTATAAGFGIGGAALSVAFPPAAAALSVVAGATQLLQLVQRRWGRRLSQVAYGARERLGDEEAAAARRLTEHEDLAALAYQAVDASMLSHHEEQARALGRVLGEALKAEPTITIDDAAMVLEALRSVDLPHLRVLSLFPSETPDMDLYADISAELGADAATVSGIIGGLQRAGLIEVSLPNPVTMVERARRGVPPVENAGWVRSAFGRRVLDYVQAQHSDFVI